MDAIDKLLNELVERIRAAGGKSILGVTLYGSAAAGDHHAAHSDLNVLCVVDAVSPKLLAAVEPVIKWWRHHGNPAPLLLSAEEVRTSTDCFPIEFHDIAERKRILFGDDFTANLVIDDSFYRAQVEHELRAKQIRLRQKAAGVLSDRDLLLRLLTDSVSTFCILARHALRLAGAPAPYEKRAIVAALAPAFHIEARSFDMLLSLREGQVRPRSVDPGSLFNDYLNEIAALIAAVDRLDR